MDRSRLLSPEWRRIVSMEHSFNIGTAMKWTLLDDVKLVGRWMNGTFSRRRDFGYDWGIFGGFGYLGWGDTSESRWGQSEPDGRCPPG